MILSCSLSSVTFQGKQILKPLSFEVSEPQLVGLLGPNGAGKTSLLRSLMSLIPYEGTIRIREEDLKTQKAKSIARAIAYLPQDRKVHWAINCYAVVMLGRIPHQPRFGNPSQQDHEAVKTAMRQMGVADFGHRPFESLSGGEKARILIARTLAQETDIIIADEPAAGLDPAHQIEMMALFKDLVTMGKTVLVSLHDLPLASSSCDRILLMKEGEIAADAPPCEALTDQLMKKVFGISIRTINEEGRQVVIPVGSCKNSSL
ncbi:MAG: ABC transporter ATP-binding protein [Sneathiellales bacterium]|nr:ABC transporter ATP-binding protein [Sneathiellales bacterium]